MNFTGKITKATKEKEVSQQVSTAIVDYMRYDVTSFHPEQEIWDAIRVLLMKKISGGPVLDDKERIVGMLSEKDCTRVLIDQAYYNHPHKDKVLNYMTTKVRCMSIDKDIFHVANEFFNTPYRRFPVVDAHGRLQGQISRRDIMSAAAKLRATHW